MNKYTSILLLKLPYCTHPDAKIVDDDFRTKGTFRPLPSLALPTLCGFIDKYKTLNYKIKAIDLNIEAYTEPDVPIDTSYYPELLEDIIKSNNYDVLGLSVMFVYNIKWVNHAVNLSRKFHPESKIIIGGGYPTLFPERCLIENDIDDAVIGEGESTFLHILNKYNNHSDSEFEKKFPFVGYASKKENGEIEFSNKKLHFIDMKDLLSPAWSYLDIKKYFKNSGDKILPIEGSRGCPYQCTFCCTYLSWGFKIRYKPIDNLIDEIRDIEKNYNADSLTFGDDNLAFNKEWIKKFLTRFIDLNLSVKLEASNFSVKHLDEEIINLLGKAGMQKIGIAVETGSPEMQIRIKKWLNFDNVRKVVEMVKNKGLHVHLNWMLGFPNETLNQINQTFDLARELRGHSNQFLTVLPYPGTKLFLDAKETNLLFFEEDDLDKFDNRKCDYLRSDEWNYVSLKNMIYDANIEMNFLNNPYLSSSEGREHMLEFCESLVLRLPQHIIAHIIAGYLHKQNNSINQYEKHYKEAIKLFNEKNL